MNNIEKRKKELQNKMVNDCIDKMKETNINAEILSLKSCIKVLREENSKLIEALEDLTKEVKLGKLNIRKDFSLINAHACALKVLDKLN